MVLVFTCISEVGTGEVPSLSKGSFEGGFYDVTVNFSH